MNPLTLEVQAAPAYEFVLSLCAISDGAGRALYEVGRGWFDDVQAAAGPELLAAIAELSGGSDKVWAHLLSLAYELPPPRDVPGFLQHLATIDAMELRLRLLGYYVRYFRRATPPEVIAAAAAGDPNAQRRFRKTSYPDDAFWQAALQALLPLDADATRGRTLAILRDWHERVFQAQEARALPVLLHDADAKTALARRMPPERVIETATNGWDYVPEPGIRHVLLIPSLVVRPLIHSFDHHEVKIICYPVADSSLLAEGDAPPPHLLRLLKALADERRLRILRRLTEGNFTLAELSAHFAISNTTLLHHMVILRAAGLVRLQSGNKRYSLRRDSLPDLPELIDRYLEGGTPATE